MFYIFKFFWKKGKLLRLPNGLSLFGEYCMQLLVHVLNRGFESINNRIAKLTNTLVHFRDKQIELEKHEILNDNDYPKLNSRYNIFIFLLALLILSECFLNYLTTLIVIPVEEDTSSFLKIVFNVARAAVALVATIGGIVAVDFVLEQVLPHRKIETYTINKSGTPRENKRTFSLGHLIVGLLLLVGIEFAIYHFGLKRAKDFEGQVGDSTEALIILSMIIPIIAGVIWWDMQQYRHALTNRKKLEKIKLKIKKIIEGKNQMNVKKDTFFIDECNAFYTTYTRFKIDKEYYNHKKQQPNEDMSNHFCRSQETFCEKAKIEVSRRISESEEKSKLFDDAIKSPGNKLNQSNILEHELEKEN